MDTEPPHLFSFSCWIVPTGPPVSLSFSLQNVWLDKAFTLQRTWPAKASWSSMTSKSASFFPEDCSTLGIAYAGPSSNSSFGSCEAYATCLIDLVNLNKKEDGIFKLVIPVLSEMD